MICLLGLYSYELCAFGCQWFVLELWLFLFLFRRIFNYFNIVDGCYCLTILDSYPWHQCFINYAIDSCIVQCKHSIIGKAFNWSQRHNWETMWNWAGSIYEFLFIISSQCFPSEIKFTHCTGIEFHQLVNTSTRWGLPGKMGKWVLFFKSPHLFFESATFFFESPPFVLWIHSCDLWTHSFIL